MLATRPHRGPIRTHCMLALLSPNAHLRAQPHENHDRP